jgi:hypothetical protein
VGQVHDPHRKRYRLSLHPLGWPLPFHRSNVHARARAPPARLDEVGGTTGLSGRTRAAGSSHERARIAVKKAISAAIDRVATVDQPLARHLQTCIRTGLNCSYEPDARDTLDWILDYPGPGWEIGHRSGTAEKFALPCRKCASGTASRCQP